MQDEQLAQIKAWLGTGSINLFGLPMCGKDTQGLRLARALNAKFLSSGMIIRAKEAETKNQISAHGFLSPTKNFLEWVLPYFERRDLWDSPLILSSVGRWKGEEDEVINVAAGANHPIKAVLSFNISEDDVKNRWQTVQNLGARETDPGLAEINGVPMAWDEAAQPQAPHIARLDDAALEVFERRIKEFNQKTIPVIRHYQSLGLLIAINADQPRDAVFAEIVAKLAQFAVSHPDPA